jgi:N utilization substance protein B
MAGNRRKSREIALQVLYQLDVQDRLTDDQGLALFYQSFGREDDDSDEASQAFANELVRGVRGHADEIDALITKASRNWRLERMARVDRNLLRLAVYELKFSTDVPSKVAINEAIEIAKRYGTAESPAFVNGILDRCLEEIGQR